jgi:hypothetical protein
MLSQTLLGHDGHVTGDLIVLARHQRLCPLVPELLPPFHKPRIFFICYMRVVIPSLPIDCTATNI